MSNFIISAFGDEIDMSLDIQMKTLDSMNIRHIEIRGVDGKNISELSLEEAKDIKRRLDKKNFKISALGSPIGKIGISDDFEEHLNIFDKLLDIAHILDTKYIRVFSFYIPEAEDPEKYSDKVLERMIELTKRAEKKNVVLLHENEKDIYGDTANRCLYLLRTINSPNFRATFDPANFIQCKVYPYPDAFNLLKDYIEYVHIKDAIMENGNVVPAGFGDGRIPEMLEELKTMNYKGFLTLEPHLGAFEGLEKLEKNVDISKIKKGGADSFEVAVTALNEILNKL